MNGTNQASDAVVTLPSSAFNDYVSRQFRTNTLANYDRTQFNLSGARAVNALGAARVAQQEKEIEDAVTAKIQQGGNVGMLRQGLQILADTENDPEGRADFLRTVGIDPQQFAKPVETRDPSSEFLGPDTPLRDPLLRGSGGGSDAYAAMNRTQSGGTNLMSSGGEGFKTVPNLVAELQSNFDQERTLQQNARLPVAERTAKVQELQTRRQELLDNIGDEVSSRKVARQNYESYLNQKAMSQPQRDKLLGEYDAYIKQLEDYFLPQEEKVTVDVATEFSRLVDMGEEAVRAGVANGTR